MDATLIILLLLGLAAGAALGMLFQRQQGASKQLGLQQELNNLNTTIRVKENLLLTAQAEAAKLQQELEEVRLHFQEKLADHARQGEQIQHLQEKLQQQKADLEERMSYFKNEFEVLANKILEEKTQKFTEQNRTNLDVILNPLKDKIQDFEKKVETAYKTEAAERNSLKGEITALMQLNKQLSDEANKLAQTLRNDNKTQGSWGELMLEKILEYSGLEKDREYKMQYSETNEEGRRLQPDAIVFLPDEKHIIIDAKVSLIAYDAHIHAQSDEERTQFLNQHTLSVRNHIKMLSEKNYQQLKNLNTPDFVLLFMPIESSFGLALQADRELYQFAWDRRIVIVTPSTLLATLKTIASVWKQEKQNRNTREIAEAAGKMYDKFSLFLADLEKINHHLDQTKKVYEEACNKLSTGRGNLIKRAQEIRALGAKVSKELPLSFTQPNPDEEDENA